MSPEEVSQIFLTWVKLMSKELKFSIFWPSSQQVKLALPLRSRKLFPNTRVIIDCTEMFIETTSSLEIQACFYRDYKHHCTVKYLVCITPNGGVSWKECI